MAVSNAAQQSYIDEQIAKRDERYKFVRLYRDYAEGKHHDFLTDEMRKLLVGEDSTGRPNEAPEVVLNVCNTIIDAEADRLTVKGFHVVAKDNEALSGELSALVWQRWNASRMDEGQLNVHYCALRDGDAYVITYFDPVSREARFAFNRQYDGDDAGIDMLYEDGNAGLPLCAVKIWTVERANTSSRAGRIQRKNVYYKDRVEKYIRKTGEGTAYANANWEPLRPGDVDYDDQLAEVEPVYPYAGGGSASVAWWTNTGTRGGIPLGIPVAHFRRQSRGEVYGRSVIADIAPGLQDEINLMNVSLLAATLLSGFKVTFATKFRPTDSVLNVAPGSIIYNEEDGTFGQLGETNLLQLRDVLDMAIKHAATLTQTPLSFFNITGQVAAEGTQKQLETGLLAKTRRNQVSLGNAYEDAIRMALKLEVVFGNGTVPLSLEQIDALEIECEWEPAQMRNEMEEVQIAEAWRRLGVPIEDVWSKLGFSQDQIADMAESADMRRNQVMGTLAELVKEAEQAQAEGANNGSANVKANQRTDSAGAGERSIA